jgi:hypothetical protein
MRRLELEKEHQGGILIFECSNIILLLQFVEGINETQLQQTKLIPTQKKHLPGIEDTIQANNKFHAKILQASKTPSKRSTSTQISRTRSASKSMKMRNLTKVSRKMLTR